MDNGLLAWVTRVEAVLVFVAGLARNLPWERACDRTF